ncbi:hypothetical protein TNCV_1770951 [Trichonephila clavipes]|nr:hypothetical protein TNCV_1770951 [Trichonephila clavipes]
MKCLRLFCRTSSAESVAVEDDNACAAPSTADKDISGFDQNIIDADSDNENEMNNAAPVPTSAEKRNTMKSMRNCLTAHSNDEMNNKMDDIEQFDAQKDNAKKNTRLFSVNSMNVLFSNSLRKFCIKFH